MARLLFLTSNLQLPPPTIYKYNKHVGADVHLNVCSQLIVILFAYLNSLYQFMVEWGTTWWSRLLECIGLHIFCLALFVQCSEFHSG